MNLYDKKKVLFLWLNNKEFHAINAANRGVVVRNIYKNTTKILKVIRKIQIVLNIFSIKPWLDSWSDELDHYETVIVHASALTPPVVRYILKTKPSIRVIVWYWNPVLKSVSVNKFTSLDCDIWSFDELDSSQYAINYNTQYYFKNVSTSSNEIENDIFFVGGDKGRLNKLLEIEQNFIDLGLKVNFHITQAGTRGQDGYKYKKRIEYNDVLKQISKSNAILDIVSEKQFGLTLRPLEALYYDKKLITNDINIVNRDFYNKNNIFVLGHDDINFLKFFLSQPTEKVSDEVWDKYDFDNWLGRFFI